MAAICYNHFWAFAICYILLNGLCYMLLHTPWGALWERGLRPQCVWYTKGLVNVPVNLHVLKWNKEIYDPMNSCVSSWYPSLVPATYIYIYIHIIDHMLFYFITGPVGRQHMLHWSLNFLFFYHLLCVISNYRILVIIISFIWNWK